MEMMLVLLFGQKLMQHFPRQSIQPIWYLPQADSGVATEKLRIDSTGQVTFADGAIDVNIASHDGTNGLKLGGTLVTATAANLNAT